MQHLARRRDWLANLVPLVSTVLCAILSIGTAHAERIAMRIDAVVTHVVDNNAYLSGRVRVGDRVRGVYAYDTSAPNQDPDDFHFGTYPFDGPADGLAVEVNGLRFRTDPTDPEVWVIVENHPVGDGSADTLWLSSSRNLFDVAVPDPLQDWGNVIYWNLLDDNARALANDLLPRDPPRLASWPEQEFAIYSVNADGNHYFQITARVTNVRACPWKVCRLESIGGSEQLPVPQGKPAPAARR